MVLSSDDRQTLGELLKSFYDKNEKTLPVQILKVLKEGDHVTTEGKTAYKCTVLSLSRQEKEYLRGKGVPEEQEIVQMTTSSVHRRYYRLDGSHIGTQILKTAEEERLEGK